MAGLDPAIQMDPRVKPGDDDWEERLWPTTYKDIFISSNPTSRRFGDRVEIVEQGGDAAGIGLVHDGSRAPGRGDHVEAADALLDPRDTARRHRQFAQAQPQEQRRIARVAGHLAADA